MKRSTHISILVFTICAAILAFGALWYTRPSAPSYIIEEAKQRQEVPLLEVKNLRVDYHLLKLIMKNKQQKMLHKLKQV